MTGDMDVSGDIAEGLGTDQSEGYEGEEADTGADDDAEEAEYQAKMAELRGKGKKDDEDPEEKEYREALKRAKGKDDREDSEDSRRDRKEDGDDDDKKPEESESKREFKLKVNGKEETHDEDSVTKWAQIGRAATQKLQKAADLERNVQGFIEQLKGDPFGTLAEMGVDVDAIAEQKLAKILERKLMSEEERRAVEMEEENQKLKSWKQQQEEQAERQRYEQEKQFYAQRFEQSIIKELEANSLPASKPMIVEVARYMKMARDKGIRDITPADVIPYVEKKIAESAKWLVGKYGGAKARELFGDQIFEDERKARIDKYKKQSSGGKRENVQQSARSPKQRFYSSIEELRDDF